MFIFIIVLILLPVTVLPLALKTSFSSRELEEMGVCLDDPDGSPSDAQPCQIKHDALKMHVVCGNA